MDNNNQLPEGWEKQAQWDGNPELGYDSYKKIFVNPFNGRKTPVFVFGKEGRSKNTPCYDYKEKDDKGNYVMESRYIVGYVDFSDWSFTVSAGAHSDYSYTGGFDGTPTILEALAEVDKMYKDNKLFK